MLERFFDFVFLSAILTFGSSLLAQLTGINFWFCVIVLWFVLETVGATFYYQVKETIKSWFRRD